MQTNALPKFDASVNTTGCCPRFNPEGWDEAELHFRDKRFLHATTKSIAHIPIDMGRVFARVLKNGTSADAFDPEQQLVLSHELSPFKAEHLFAVTKNVPGEEMTTLSGKFVTKVFEGPYRKMGDWSREMEDLARERGHEPKSVRFYYTTCPKCAKAYGGNPVVGLVEI